MRSISCLIFSFVLLRDSTSAGYFAAKAQAKADKEAQKLKAKQEKAALKEQVRDIRHPRSATGLFFCQFLICLPFFVLNLIIV